MNRNFFIAVLILAFASSCLGKDIFGGLNCTKDSECHEGRCRSNECVCQEYYMDADCSRHFGDRLGAAWTAYVAITSIPFILITIFMSLYLAGLLIQRRWVTNVANVCFLFVFIAMVCRVLFNIDPFGSFGITHFVYWNLFYYTTFNSGFTAMTFLLVFWVDILRRQQKKGGKQTSALVESKRLKWVLIISNSSLWIFYLVSIILLIVGSEKDLGDTEATVFRIWRIYLAICCLAFCIGFGFYGYRLYHNFQKTFVIKSENIKNMIKKVTIFTVGSFVTLFLTVIYLLIGVVFNLQAKPVSFLVYQYLARIIEITLTILQIIVLSRGNPLKRFLAIFKTGISLSGQTSRDGMSKTENSAQPNSAKEGSHISDSDLDVEKVDWGEGKTEQS